jgi:hypothetical protein
MGMDVLGMAPSAPVGEYFRRNTFNWAVLVDCLTTLCPLETSRCTHWDENVGDGLDAADTAALVEKLETLQENGDIDAYCRKRDAWADHRSAGPGFGPAESKAKGVKDRLQALADRAGVQGTVMPSRSFNPNEIREFLAFLRASGGFQIA